MLKNKMLKIGIVLSICMSLFGCHGMNKVYCQYNFGCQKNDKDGYPIYHIGCFGQAGIVFYDKGQYTNGWRYLEVAPSSSELLMIWTESNIPVPMTLTEVGTGKVNTFEIVQLLGERGKAAHFCMNLSIPGYGYTDWFLPSRDELNQMYLILKKKNIGELKNAVYWSSSQHSNSEAWYQNFANGDQYFGFKNDVYMVRAVRAF